MSTERYHERGADANVLAISDAVRGAVPMKHQTAFRALADPTRRDILAMLATKDMTIAEVAGHFSMTRAAVKKHLIVLSDGNLITVTPSGRERINSLNPDGFRVVSEWLGFFDRFWDDRLSALKTAIEEGTKHATTDHSEDGIS